MKSVFLFPGQGAQSVGMGISVANDFPEAAALFDAASETLGYDLRALCENGPVEKLSRTLYTQPALFTVEAAITDVLKSGGVSPDCAAGHSLGEFVAWYAAEVYSFENGLKLVAERARIMDSAGESGAGAMSAVIGCDIDVVDNTCGEVDGTVVVANINSPGQVVISGEKDAVARAGTLLTERGAKRVVPLKVSGAFHSPLMKSAREEFAEIVRETPMKNASVPVYSNVTGKAVCDADDIRQLMPEQLTSTVRWVDSVTAMVSDGVETAFEIGPGSVLAGLVKRIDRNLPVVPVRESEHVREVING